MKKLPLKLAAGAGTVEFERDFIVKDANGEAIINAVSKWVIMDINTRRLKRSDLIGLRYPEKITQRAIPGKLARLAPFGQPEEVYTKVIGYSDIDFNGHLNNSKYVDYMMDCFPVEEHRARSIQSIDIQFTMKHCREIPSLFIKILPGRITISFT